MLFYQLVEQHLETKINCRGKEGQLVVRWPSSVYNDGKVTFFFPSFLQGDGLIGAFFFLEFIDWKALGGEYLQANMCKIGVDTMNAINIISSKAA